jgi:hypothetical protein
MSGIQDTVVVTYHWIDRHKVDAVVADLSRKFIVLLVCLDRPDEVANTNTTEATNAVVGVFNIVQFGSESDRRVPVPGVAGRTVPMFEVKFDAIELNAQAVPTYMHCEATTRSVLKLNR